MSHLFKFARGLILALLVPVALTAVWAGWTLLSIRQDDVAFRSGELTLRGTLLSPRFGRQAPGVVLVHGSGQTSRKAMMAYAWIFASQGYAALAYDKRGVGASGGGPTEWREFSFEHLADDAAAAYRFVQSRPGVNPRRVGYFAASQGGWVVSLAANRAPAPAFLILASASVSTVAEDRLYGREVEVLHAGSGEAAARDAVGLLALDHQVTRTGRGYDAVKVAFDRARSAPWFADVYPEGGPLPADDPHRAWERTILDFDPRPHLQTIGAPVLWIFGDPDLDRFSPVRLSRSRIEAAIAAGRPYTIIAIPSVGHTLELEGDRDLETFVQVRLPLLWRIFGWLKAH